MQNSFDYSFAFTLVMMGLLIPAFQPFATRVVQVPIRNDSLVAG